MENLPSFQKILIAVDDTKYSYNAAKYGFTLARKLFAEVAIVHINEMPIATNITADPLIGDPGILIPNILDIQKENAHKLLDTLIEDLSLGQEVKQYILDGDITNEVIHAAEDFNASLIVLGTHSRTGISHFISGSIAESITRHSLCPVLIVPLKTE